MSEIDFKNQIKMILSQQKNVEEKLDIIIKDLRNLRNRMISNHRKSQRKRLNLYAVNTNYYN
jgi:hypothetical protein